MDRQEVSPAPSSLDVPTAIARIADARAERTLTASEAMIAQSTVVVASVFGPGRFAPETVKLRRVLLERCGLTLEAVAADDISAAQAHARAFAPRPPKLRRSRRSAGLTLVAAA
jgi:hypothetical protein